MLQSTKSRNSSSLLRLPLPFVRKLACAPDRIAAARGSASSRRIELRECDLQSARRVRRRWGERKGGATARETRDERRRPGATRAAPNYRGVSHRWVGVYENRDEKFVQRERNCGICASFHAFVPCVFIPISYVSAALKNVLVPISLRMKVLKFCSSHFVRGDWWWMMYIRHVEVRLVEPIL